MKCPNCNETLVMADRQGVEIDYCPNCRGVWLDRGELDKIIERSAAYMARDEGQQQYNSPKGYDSSKGGDSRKGDYDQYKGDYNKPHYNDPHYQHKKKKGFLSDFFDFD